MRISEVATSSTQNDCQNRIVERNTFSDTQRYSAIMVIVIDKKKRRRKLPEILSQLIHCMLPEMFISRPIKMDWRWFFDFFIHFSPIHFIGSFFMRQVWLYLNSIKWMNWLFLFLLLLSIVTVCNDEDSSRFLTSITVTAHHFYRVFTFICNSNYSYLKVVREWDNFFAPTNLKLSRRWWWCEFCRITSANWMALDIKNKYSKWYYKKFYSIKRC